METKTANPRYAKPVKVRLAMLAAVPSTPAMDNDLANTSACGCLAAVCKSAVKDCAEMRSLRDKPEPFSNSGSVVWDLFLPK